jgi:hypothetical protein
VVDPSSEGEDHVLLAPDDPLRHPGGAAGVEHVEVVRRARPEVTLGTGVGQRSLVGNRAERREVLAARVVDRHEVAELRQAVANRGDARGELALVHHRHQVGVVEQVVELLLHVAVVHVDGNRAQLVAGEHRLHELGAVVGVDADVIAGLHPVRGQVVCGAVGALVERREAVTHRSGHQRLSLGDGVSGGLDQVGDVELHRGTSVCGQD